MGQTLSSTIQPKPPSPKPKTPTKLPTPQKQSSPQRNVPTIPPKKEEKKLPSNPKADENAAPDATEIMDRELTAERESNAEDDLSELAPPPQQPDPKPKAVASVTPKDVRDCFLNSNQMGPHAEKATLSGSRDDYSTLCFSNYHDVYTVKNQRQRTHPRIRRWRADPWRRYGTQKIIHQLGGYVPVAGSTVKGRKRELKYVPPGTPMPPPPMEKPIMTMDEFFRRPVMIRGGPRADEDADEDDETPNRRSTRRRSSNNRTPTLEDLL